MILWNAPHRSPASPPAIDRDEDPYPRECLSVGPTTVPDSYIDPGLLRHVLATSICPQAKIPSQWLYSVSSQILQYRGLVLSQKYSRGENLDGLTPTVTDSHRLNHVIREEKNVGKYTGT